MKPAAARLLGMAVHHLLAADSVYVAAHIMPDGDAVGSLLGLGGALHRLGKRCTLSCADPIPAKFDFLAGVEDIVARPPQSEDIIVSVDSSDLQRLGSSYDEAIFTSRPVINIDHHTTNTGFGDVNLVLDYPSTAEIVLLLVGALGCGLTPHIATALLTGLVTDTRCFRTGNVTAEQLRTSIALMEAGASLSRITELVFNRDPRSNICLWGQALSRVQWRGGIVWTEIPKSAFSGCAAPAEQGAGLVSFLAGHMGVDVAVVFREREDGGIEASIRSAPAWDVSAAAFKLGGGGHPRAAGSTLHGTMEQVRERVLAQLESSLAEQARSSAGGSAG